MIPQVLMVELKWGLPMSEVPTKPPPVSDNTEKILHSSTLLHRLGCSRETTATAQHSLNLRETVLSTSLVASPGCLAPILVQILTAWVGGKLPELLPHLQKFIAEMG